MQFDVVPPIKQQQAPTLSLPARAEVITFPVLRCDSLRCRLSRHIRSNLHECLPAGAEVLVHPVLHDVGVELWGQVVHVDEGALPAPGSMQKKVWQLLSLIQSSQAQ